MTEAAANTQCP